MIMIGAIIAAGSFAIGLLVLLAAMGHPTPSTTNSGAIMTVAAIGFCVGIILMIGGAIVGALS